MRREFSDFAHDTYQDSETVEMLVEKMDLNCSGCRKAYGRGRPEHFGSDPVCGFDADGRFRTWNWNCVTLNGLRDLVEGYVWNDDPRVGVIRVPENDNEGEERGPIFVLVRWYKSRGRTDEVLWWCETPRPITLDEAEATLSAASARGAWAM